jgi:hypothetical protein
MTRMMALLTVWLALISYADTSLDESYEFYSSIYKNSPSLGADEMIAIGEEATAVSSNPHCLKPVAQEERRMAGAFLAIGAQHVKWERRFSFGRAYLLIPPAETKKAIDCIQEYKLGCEAYTKMRYVRFLSVPVFNRDHTRALLTISRACGGLCGNGSLQVYRKTSAGWEREPDSFAQCIWIS